jgi:hypothetical protein
MASGSLASKWVPTPRAAWSEVLVGDPRGLAIKGEWNAQGSLLTRQRILRDFAAILTALLAIVLLFGCKLGDSREVRMVKQGHLEAYPNKTVGEAFDAFLEDPVWESDIADDGTEFVNVEGELTVGVREVHALMQFEIDKTNHTFQATALEFNEVPQARLIMGALLKRVFG